MRKCDVRSPEEALAYITDCNLATISSLAMKKTRGKHEYERQISIAQCAYDWMIAMGVDINSTRAVDVERCNGSVSEWAKHFDVCEPLKAE